MQQKYLRPTNKIFSKIFILFVLLFICLCFQSYKLGEINFFLTGGHSRELIVNDWAGNLKSIVSLCIILIVILLCFEIKRIKTSLSRPLVTLLLYFTIAEILRPSGDGLLINRISSQSLWIILFFGFCSYFTGISKKQISRFVKFSYWFVFFLFVINYVNGLVLGIEWSYIEAYFMLTLLPLIIIFIEKKYIYFIITFICLILASKRTGLITYTIVIIYFFYNIQPKLSNKIKTIIVFIMTTTVVYLAAIFIFPNQIERVSNRFSEIEEDGGSGRDLIFERVGTAILEGDACNLLFGHGYNTVCKSDINDGYSAHNDFLEVLYDYGIIGFILYISIYLRLWRLSNSPYLSRIHKIGCRMAFFIMLLLSFTSHLILFTNSIIFLIAFLSFTELLIF